MTDIVVEINKGMVTGLYCDLRDAQFVVVDWDLTEREGAITSKCEHESLSSLPPRTKAQLDHANAV